MSTGNAIFIRQAQIALKAGQKQAARHWLQQAVRQNPQDYAGWLWLASVTSSPRTALEYVKRAEMLNPEAPAVRKARVWAENRLQAESAAPTQPTLPPPVQADGGQWRRLALWAGIALALVAVLFLAGAFVWNGWNTAWPAVAEPVTEGVLDQVAAVVEPVTAGEEPAQLLATPTATPPRIQAKAIAFSSDPNADEPRPRWTPTLMPTSTPTPVPTPVPTFVSALNQSQIVSRPFGVGSNERWIDVNLTTQTLTAYEGDLPVLTSLISSGTWQHPTVTGQFRVYLRYESQTMDGRRLGYDYYLEGVPYVMYFYEDYALHGTFWHTNFGTPMSHGCVNMNTPDAQWLFNWSTIGTVVNVHY